jgi:hypothetical protein
MNHLRIFFLGLNQLSVCVYDVMKSIFKNIFELKI